MDKDNIEYKILVVDSELLWRNRLEQWLGEGFIVSVAKNYEEAIQYVLRPELRFDVIVTEISLDETSGENKDGFNLIDQLIEIGKNIKTVILTRYGTASAARIAFKEKKAFDFLEKHDVNHENFRQRIREAAQETRVLNHDVFVLMPFDNKYTTFYEEVIKTEIENIGLRCRRVDDFYLSSSIVGDIVRCIRDAMFVLADLSGRNPNVFLEVGIAHALGKSVLLLTQDLDDVPPKLQTIRCHVYQNSIEGARKIEDVLPFAIRGLQQANFPRFFDNYSFNMMPKTGLALLPSDAAGERTYDTLICEAMEEVDCTVEKASAIFSSTSVLDEIWARINTSQVVIADLSEWDPDVFYLTGLAYGLRKKVIYIIKEGNQVPFDLKSGSHLKYSLNSYADAMKAKRALTSLIRNLVESIPAS